MCKHCSTAASMSARRLSETGGHACTLHETGTACAVLHSFELCTVSDVAQGSLIHLRLRCYVSLSPNHTKQTTEERENLFAQCDANLRGPC